MDIIAGIEMAWKVGQVLIEYCQTWKAAEEEVSDRVIIVESAWFRISKQLEFLQEINLEDQHRRILDDLVRVLVTRLSAAITLINQTLKGESEKRPALFKMMPRATKPRYLLLKSAIDDAIKEVEDWISRFDPSWYLVIRTADMTIENKLVKARESEARRASPSLKRHLRQTQTPFQAAQGLREALRPDSAPHLFLKQIDLERHKIVYSSAQTAREMNNPYAPWLIIDSVVCHPGTDPNAMARDVRALARKLTKADPLAFGLLSCKGIIKMPVDPVSGRQHASLDLVLRMPKGFESGKSLRQFLLEQHDQNNFVSLSRHVAIAKDLARSVSSVHTFKFVHKNVRPESVLLLYSAEADAHAGFLVGFDNFRAADGATNLRGDTEWDRNMYRHPSRQGEYPEEKYRMHHDIYSLGVCLLELGLHESFVSYDAVGVPQPGPLFGNFNEWLESSGHGGTWGASVFLKDYFIDMTLRKLPRFMGDKYAQIVLTCLTCLDDDSNDFGEEVDLSDRDGITLGMKFIQKILLQINELSV
ncbi:hypothetical protein DL765_010952 [Monosporascus sp. GIB2]|nr:hypothetical protein DL765_010952 [Monosporascus sp. GIB2]